MKQEKKLQGKVGIMGGTFDPIHIGHLILAEQACAQFKLDRILFMPTSHPPHKDGQAVTEAALRRDIVHCYATEGFYPPSLEYLEEHYGLTYDKNRYWVDYQPVGSNLMPDITVLEIH